MSCKCRNGQCGCNLSSDQRTQSYREVIQRMEDSGIASPKTAEKLRDNVDKLKG